MKLPHAAAACLQALEQAGFEAYVVGGCVRDALLGNTPHDYDICTSATPSETCQVFQAFPLIHNGQKHGTVGVVREHQVYEITTFRSEGNYQDSRHPGWVRFVPTVEEDLARRDFTINAMAYSPARGYIDPFGGQADLMTRTLRAVGNPLTRFQEDALRILRGVRFAVRFGLTPTEETLHAMRTLSPNLNRLARERVFEEICRLLPLISAQALCTYAPVLTQAIPELAPLVGFCQHNPHHAYDVYTHTAHVVAQMPRELPLRWAALLHDTGKPAVFTMDGNGRGHFMGHAETGARIADTVLRSLKAPTALREQVVFLVGHHMLLLEPDKRILRRRLGKYGAEAICRLLTLQKGDFAAKGTNLPLPGAFAETEALIAEILSEEHCLTVRDLAINGRDLIALGLAPGPEIGRCLEALLALVQDEVIENTPEALLAAVKEKGL